MKTNYAKFAVVTLALLALCAAPAMAQVGVNLGSTTRTTGQVGGLGADVAASTRADAAAQTGGVGSTVRGATGQVGAQAESATSVAAEARKSGEQKAEKAQKQSKRSRKSKGSEVAVDASTSAEAEVNAGGASASANASTEAKAKAKGGSQGEAKSENANSGEDKQQGLDRALERVDNPTARENLDESKQREAGRQPMPAASAAGNVNSSAQGTVKRGSQRR